MRPVESIHRAASILVVLTICACAGKDTTGVTPPPPPPLAGKAWSDPATWPLHAVPAPGDSVLIPAGDTVILDLSTPSLGALQIDGVLHFKDNTDLSLTAERILVNGALHVGSEAWPFQHNATITLTGPESGDNALNMRSKGLLVAPGGLLELHGQPRTAWVHLGATTPAGARAMTLDQAPNWRAGDQIVIASSDFDPARAQVLQVTGVSGPTVQVTPALEHAHWGTTQTFQGQTLDERAEVGLLTRNIVVRGDEASTTNGYGGHIAVLQSGVAHIEGVELYYLGQESHLARYPMHWHVAADVHGQYFRNSSVWRSFNRCVTVHGSHNATVEGNVCYDHIGHGYFMEDGIEHGNTIRNNLGLGTRTPPIGRQVLASDLTPSTFWITNPSNTITGNVAAGSTGFGYWIALPLHPTGLSTTDAIWPRRTPLVRFDNNVAHSNANTGLQVDNGPNPDGTTSGTDYEPVTNPADSTSAPVVATFDHYTGYKQRGRAAWLRGSNLTLTNAVLADNGIGATFAADATTLTSSVIIGESANNATHVGGGFPIRGYEFYDGVVGADGVTFFNFTPDATHQASALGFNRNDEFSLSPSNYAGQLTFVGANRVYVDDPASDKDGDKAAVFLDQHGMVTGTAGMYVAANSPILYTPACTRHVEWNAWACPLRYVTLVMSSAQAGENTAPATLTRDDGASVQLAGNSGTTTRIMMNVITGRSYTMQPGAALTKPRIRIQESQPGDTVMVALPYSQSTFAIWRDYDSSQLVTAAPSLDAFNASAGELYFYDSVAHVLHVKLVTQAGKRLAAISVDPR